MRTRAAFGYVHITAERDSEGLTLRGGEGGEGRGAGGRGAARRLDRPAERRGRGTGPHLRRRARDRRGLWVWGGEKDAGTVGPAGDGAGGPGARY